MTSTITKILLRESLVACNAFKNVQLKTPMLYQAQCILNGSLTSRFLNIKNDVNPWLKNSVSVRFLTPHSINRPDPTTYKKRLDFIPFLPEDGKYTIRKLPMRKLGGRDPETGRKIFGCIGGGHKRKYRWVQDHRVPPDHNSDTIVEKVVGIQYDPNRTANIALVGQSDKVRFIIATENMKAGDMILSTKELPLMHIRPKEGNAHPVGALPMGTEVCCIESKPGGGMKHMVNAGCHGTVIKRVKREVFVSIDKKRELALDPRCIVVVGRVSNLERSSKPIGSGWRLRWLGRRPRSGLFQKKDGRFGKKNKSKKTIRYEEPKVMHPVIHLTAHGQGPKRPVIPSTLR